MVSPRGVGWLEVADDRVEKMREAVLSCGWNCSHATYLCVSTSSLTLFYSETVQLTKDQERMCKHMSAARQELEDTITNE